MSPLAVLAGLVSTMIFASSMLPMVVKAVATRDLSSYSLSHLVLVNSGNALYSFYVYALPLGPIWVLHTFHLTTSVVMLVWYLRFVGARPRDASTAAAAARATPEATPAPAATAAPASATAGTDKY